jgi:hypothetical protein
MKRMFLIFGLLIAIILTGLRVNAKANHLHSIVLEKNNSGYNVILQSDEVAKVVRRFVSNDEIVLELSGITSSDTVNALYKGTNDVDNLIIENTSFNKMKIYITAPNISSSSVLVEPQFGSGVLAGEGFPTNKVIWTIMALVIVGIIYRSSRRKSVEDNGTLIRRDIKDREIELYRRYRKNFEEESLNSNKITKMRTMLKKIDRKIDERLMSSIK